MRRGGRLWFGRCGNVTVSHIPFTSAATLYKYYANTIQILYEHYTSTIQTIYKYYTNAMQILHKYKYKTKMSPCHIFHSQAAPQGAQRRQHS